MNNSIDHIFEDIRKLEPEDQESFRNAIVNLEIKKDGTNDEVMESIISLVHAAIMELNRDIILKIIPDTNGQKEMEQTERERQREQDQRERRIPKKTQRKC